jgi:hypothetical protein
MCVKGSSIAYEHSALLWLFERNAVTIGDRTLVWQLVSTIGAYNIYRFTQHAGVYLSDPVPRYPSFGSANCYGHHEVFSASFSSIDVALPRRVLFWGPFVLVQQNNVTVRIEKELLVHAQMCCMNQLRTKELFRTVTAKVIARAHQLDYNDHDLPRRVRLAVALGFVMGLDQESSLLSDCVIPSLAQHGNYESMLSLMPTVVGWRFRWEVLSPLGFIFGFKTGVICTAVGAFLVLRRRGLVTLDVSYYLQTSRLNITGPVPPIVLPAHEPCTVLKKRDGLLSYGYRWVRERMRGPMMCGILWRNAVPIVTADTPDVEYLAINNRALVYPNKPQPGAWSMLKASIERAGVLKTLRRGIRAYPFSAWNSRFPRPRQVAQSRALATFELCATRDEARRACLRNTFVKREKLLKICDGIIEDYDPRVIQGVGDLANCLLGPWMLAHSKDLAATWDLDSMITYAAGLTCNQLGSWADATSGFVCFLANDFSRFDASVSSAAIEFEHDLYRSRGAPYWALQVLNQQRKVVGRSAHGHRYNIDGTRCSGDPNTSPGNALLDACAILYAWIECTGVQQPTRDDLRIIVNGDDACVASNYHVDVVQFMAALHSLGFKPKTKLFNTVEELDFCSGRFWACTVNGVHTHVFGPMPGKLMSRIGASVSRVTDPLRWFRGVLLGFERDTNHVPLVSQLVKRGLHLTSGCKTRPIQDEHKFHVSVEAEACPETYAQLHLVYGLTAADVESFERYLTTINSLPFVADHYVMDILVGIDC